ncbi:aminotransferase class V-fold PLP-dependent enzyme [Anaplasma marginale]|uniref:Aminotransferase class V-fold PLP-dependent enzyme n=1 Tax=Anaplasma marginale TaxID=770 RepID=A0A643CMQ5_ANAMA|nr:aminotransferase class V-fold PLP-dependent enzyme [Anaplasma marginale]KAA8472468.1 aminotransferase class V-fold PLP-dependent enzyme [Anaplasma marginale]KAA8474426.1 aminotransferase class V-fold PLP-dependent enzyme [Anaplasma marginale]KAB0450870.1 aminotransferase class V-fold PLP-dependent enzyme [Anaplasma marginale]KAB0452105.1 aminotransferase class V-fold PLP-dependent enzyme [Anaplasma marginale]
MLMTTRLRYAVMFMVGLLNQGQPGGAFKPKRASSIADKQSLSEGYLERVITSLKNKGLVKSTRGPGGGYSLGMPPEHITLDLLLDSVGDKVRMVRCGSERGGCLPFPGVRCNSHNLWDGIERYVMHYLKNTSILDVFNNNLRVVNSDDGYIYADYNATAAVSAQVRHKLGNELLFGGFYNPSSVHRLGQKTRGVIEDARRTVVNKLDAAGYDVVFTSSGTEANNLVFRSSAGYVHIISAIEHPSVMNAATDPMVIPVNGSGVVSLDALDGILSSLGGKKALVSVMLANNEVGTIQPVQEVVKLARKYGAVVHTDIVQACGKIPVSVLGLGADFVTISSHKIGGIPGAGALLFNSKNVQVEPMIFGGLQERGLRAGTENVVAICSLSIALEDIQACVGRMSAVRQMRDLLEKKISELVPECVIFGRDVDRLPNTTCVSMPGVSKELQVMGFDSHKVAIGVGSACSSGKPGASHVLSALGVSDECAQSAVRISLGPGVTEAQVCKIADCWYGIYNGFRMTVN